MEPVLYIGIAQALFAAFLMVNNNPKTLANKISTVWLCLIAVYMLAKLLLIQGLGFEFLQLILFAAIPLTFGPFLYIYTRTLISEYPAFKKDYWLHFIPFLIFLISLFYNRYEMPREIFINEISSGYRVGLSPLGIRVYSITMFLSLSTYIIWILFLLKRHSLNILNNFSYSSEKINLNWLKVITVAFAFVFLSMIFSTLLRFFSIDINIRPDIFSFSAFTIFVFIFAFYASRQPQIYSDNSAKNQDIENGNSSALANVETISPKTRYEKSGLTVDNAESYLQILEKYMQEEKPYLDEELTIQDISQKLSIPKHHLTQVLNEKLHKNFYTFINEYRVEEVKKRMLNSQYKNLTLLAIAYDCGFNSKSGFNTIFKRLEKMTPSQFRKKYLAQ